VGGDFLSDFSVDQKSGEEKGGPRWKKKISWGKRKKGKKVIGHLKKKGDRKGGSYCGERKRNAWEIR